MLAKKQTPSQERSSPPCTLAAATLLSPQTGVSNSADPVQKKLIPAEETVLFNMESKAYEKAQSLQMATGLRAN